MIFDDRTELVLNPNGGEQKSIAEACGVVSRKGYGRGSLA